MNLQEEITKQRKAGFSVDEIRTNLINLQFDPQEIDNELKNISKYPRANSSGGTDMKTIGSVALGIFIIIRIIIRLYRLAD